MEEAWGDLVLSWIPHQRWFAGKGLKRSSSRIVRRLTVNQFLHILIAEVNYHDKAEPEYYQVPIVIRSGPPSPADPNYIGASAEGHVFDGVGDCEGSAAILNTIRSGVTGYDFSGTALEVFDAHTPRAVTTEQSNSSVVFDDRYIMKVFRQLWPGRNPDLTLNLELARANNKHVARPLGWLSSREGGSELTLALVQEYFAAARQGWQLATASLAAHYADTPVDGYDFADDAFHLGVATAQVHDSLAQRLSSGALDDRNTRDLAERVTVSFQNRARIAPKLRQYETGVDELVDRFARNCPGLPTQRIHNDLHLTQVLRTPASWILIDFEGEPNISIDRRNEFFSPLRDVACMLRSFDYAAFFVLRESAGSTHPAALAELTDGWLTKVRSTFWNGYTSASGTPSDTYSEALLFFELEKALFEIDYEYNNRPDWFEVATESTYRLLSRDPEATHHGGG